MKIDPTIFFIFFISFVANAQITLTHNIGNTPIVTGMTSCDEDESWSRVFKLADFGVTKNEQFVITSGQVGISKSYNGARLTFAIYSVDSNFPNSKPRYIGSGPSIMAPVVEGAPQLITINFEDPVVVPAGVENILVEVSKMVDTYNPNSPQVVIAGTAEDNDISYFYGCRAHYIYIPTTDLDIPVPDANFLINVTGEKQSLTSSGSTTRLSHNICDDLIETRIHSCKHSGIFWARAFNLSDFGISNNEELILNSGQVGINKTGWLPEVRFNIYKIDDNFPSSFSETDLIGSSQYQRVSPNIDRSSKIIQVDFDTPIIIPAGVERILVEVHKGIIYGDGVAFIAGSAQSNDVSWQRGCTNVAGGPQFGDEYVSTADFGRPDANFYINITGNVKHVINKFNMNITNICSEFLKEFSIEDKANVSSVTWDFGDPASGTNNSSTDLSPFHDFSIDGKFTVTATVTGTDNNVEVLTETIDVKQPPNAYGINNVYACEDSFGSGFSSSFDLSTVENQVLQGQTNKIVTYIDGLGKWYSTLPNLFANSVKDRETITVRVARPEELCCYSETTFDLIINPLPNLSTVTDVLLCDDNDDGFTTFNLKTMSESIMGTATNLEIEFFHEDGQMILNSDLNHVVNKVRNEEVITVKVRNSDTNCHNELTFKLIVNSIPIANILSDLIGCDDNNDGISEYFDTSTIESEVLGNQTGMNVNYFRTDGTPFESPLPNPFTNTVANAEVIVVRVTNTTTNCYAETSLTLKTSNKPQINAPQNIVACDEGSGFAHFDMSIIKDEIIGTQQNLAVTYYDDNGTDITGYITSNFQNTKAWTQTIFVKVENELSNLCVSETKFNLIVNELPKVSIENDYFICNLEPSMSVSVNPNLDSHIWTYEDGTVVSNTFQTTISDAGKYTLTVGEIKNGIMCNNSYNFKLIRSVLPVIDTVEIQELSDHNFIKIMASGDGDFEYSIDGVNYQNNHEFYNILGGHYTVYVRDKFGCGSDSSEVTVMDYPKFFTPNNDGYNDNWQIRGINKFPNSKIFIFDRYGKLLKQLSSSSLGWDGTYNGKNMASNDYWFRVQMDDGKILSGHFTLKR